MEYLEAALKKRLNAKLERLNKLRPTLKIYQSSTGR